MLRASFSTGWAADAIRVNAAAGLAPPEGLRAASRSITACTTAYRCLYSHSGSARQESAIGLSKTDVLRDSQLTKKNSQHSTSFLQWHQDILRRLYGMSAGKLVNFGLICQSSETLKTLLDIKGVVLELTWRPRYQSSNSCWLRQVRSRVRTDWSVSVYSSENEARAKFGSGCRRKFSLV